MFLRYMRLSNPPIPHDTIVILSKLKREKNHTHEPFINNIPRNKQNNRKQENK